MAAPIAFVVNEYYETRFIPESETSSDPDPHPHPPLRPFKIIMVSDIMPETSQIVFKWPSIDSMAFFFRDQTEILPEFDFHCTLTEDEATRLIKYRVDPLELCFYSARLSTTWFWLHDQGLALLDAVMAMAPEVDHLRQTMRNSIKDDQFYAIQYENVRDQLQRDRLCFQRVAWVRRQFIDRDSEPTVEISTPSVDSLLDFLEGSATRMLPEFNRVFHIPLCNAKLIFLRIMPLELCFKMRMRRDFWVDIFELDCYRFSLTADQYGPYGDDTSGTSADADDATGGPRAGGDAHADVGSRPGGDLA